mgnify:FL=1
MAKKEWGSFHITGHIEKNGLVAMSAGTRANIVPESCEAIIEGNYKQYENSYHEFLQTHHITGTIEEEGNCTKLVLKGKSAHASTPEEGINAVCLMAQYLDTVLDNGLIHFIVNHLCDYYGQGLKINHDGQMGPLTMNLGVLVIVKNNVKLI